MTPSTASSARGQKTREAILDAAAKLVAERGWGNVSTRMVAERAQVRPGLIHYYFASQDDLLAEAAVHALRIAVQSMVTLVRADPPAALEAIPAGLAAQDVAVDPTFLLGIETYLAAARDPGLAAALRGLYQGLRDDFAETLAAEGLPDAGTRAALLAAALDGLVMHRAADPSFPIEAAAQLLISWVRREEVPA